MGEYRTKMEGICEDEIRNAAQKRQDATGARIGGETHQERTSNINIKLGGHLARRPKCFLLKGALQGAPKLYAYVGISLLMYIAIFVSASVFLVGNISLSRPKSVFSQTPVACGMMLEQVGDI